MSGRASKNKGKAWERDICKYLSETLGGSFIRVPNSGAFIGGTNNIRKQSLSSNQISVSKGDIIPPEHLPKLNLEAKNYSDIAFHQIINGNCKQLDAWIEQTEMPADTTDISFTIFKITRKGSWVAFKYELFEYFILGSHVIYVKDELINPKKYIITDYERFFKDNKEKIIELAS